MGTEHIIYDYIIAIYTLITPLQHGTVMYNHTTMLNDTWYKLEVHSTTLLIMYYYNMAI